MVCIVLYEAAEGKVVEKEVLVDELGNTFDMEKCSKHAFAHMQPEFESVLDASENAVGHLEALAGLQTSK